MRQLKLLIILSLLFSCGLCKAASINVEGCYSSTNQQDSLSVYTGKYQMVQGKGTFYVIVKVTDGQLIANATWDGSKLLLKHLTGDSFIVSGLDWSIKFTRDKDNTVTQMVVRGTDFWTKVKQ